MANSISLENYAELASRSLLYELDLSPKPGLVDRLDAGAHKDMTYETFLTSIEALNPFFLRYLEVGWRLAGQKPQLIFEELRKIGIQAEQTMFQATKGVNTHKGINFSLALVLGATGIYLSKRTTTANYNKPLTPQDSLAICQLAQQLAAHIIQADLSQLETKEDLSHGEKLYLTYGIKGPRGEAAAGFPTVVAHALPFFRQELNKRQDKEFCQWRLLLYLMGSVEDANLIHRGGLLAWQRIKKEARSLLNSDFSKSELKQQLTAYNQILIQRYLSPGGSADFLSLTFYFAFLEKLL